MPKRVAVIGAGPSGLVAVKELLEEGHEPTCLERAPGPGGVFRFDEDAGVVWESCRLTSSGLVTAFSDFPVPADRAGHMTVGEYVDYLARYCAAFGVDRHIRFGTTVESVAQSPEGNWLVQTIAANGDRSEELYDAVAVCSGLHQHPDHPRFEGQETFPGQVMHGVQYRGPTQVAGKRVLVVGAGESGADIVAEVSDHAVETVLSLRRGVAVLPRTLLGHPNDYRTCRINNSPAHWIFQTRNPTDDRKRDVYRIVFLPFVVIDKLVQTTSLLTRRIGSFLRLRRLGTEQLAEARLERETAQLITRLLHESGGTRFEQFGTKSADFVRAMAAGRCRQATAVDRFDGGSVIFADGSSFEPDLVILCTGFEVKLPFLDEATVRAPRYLRTFASSIGSSLGFIGFVRPGLGAIPPLAELQARWFARLLSERAFLPDLTEMQASIDRSADFRQHVFRAVQGRLDYLVDYTSLCDELASMIGCKPSRRALRGESLRFRRRFFIAPFVAAQYRLVGPHAKPWIARQVITNLPVAYPIDELALFYLRWTLSRALCRLLGPRYAPKLVLH